MEDVCLRFKGIETLFTMSEFMDNRGAAIDFLKPRIEKYNRAVNIKNDELYTRLDGHCELHTDDDTFQRYQEAVDDCATVID